MSDISSVTAICGLVLMAINFVLLIYLSKASKVLYLEATHAKKTQAFYIRIKFLKRNRQKNDILKKRIERLINVEKVGWFLTLILIILYIFGNLHA